MKINKGKFQYLAPGFSIQSPYEQFVFILLIEFGFSFLPLDYKVHIGRAHVGLVLSYLVQGWAHSLA